jgi:DNA polymerase-1
MWAQRVLYPEFKIALDNVGRLYTNEPYWKDTGKDHKSEGGKRDWGNIRDWPAHYRYNCLDTTGTFEACGNQRRDLDERGQLTWFYNYVMRLGDPIVEMCSHGLPVSEVRRARLERECTARVQGLIAELSKPINPGSSKQKIELFKSKKYRIPTKKGKPSMDELALKKMRLKHPDDQDIKVLLQIAKLNKALSSYIKVEYDPDNRMRFTIRNCGTETMRFAGGKDPWDRGLNVQTLPKEYKHMFVAPPGKLWMNVDLKQAESRYVAYKSQDIGMINMLEDPSMDIHRFVASKIFNIPESEVTKQQRNELGKKSGHGANYDMHTGTFQDSCLKELDLVITKKEAERVLETYHSLFPGIRRGHARVRSELYGSRCLTNPMGYRRYFYGRMDDNTFREAYAFEPQSTIPMVVNALMLALLEKRTAGELDFTLHLQCHDSLTLMVDDDPNKYLPVATVCDTIKDWHPEIILPAGQLLIPTSIELGIDLGNMKELHL